MFSSFICKSHGLAVRFLWNSGHDSAIKRGKNAALRYSKGFGHHRKTRPIASMPSEGVGSTRFQLFQPKKLKEKKPKSAFLLHLTSSTLYNNLSLHLFLSVCRYSNPLEALGHHVSGDLALTKRHFFEIPTQHCNLDLDDYEYEDDFE